MERHKVEETTKGDGSIFYHHCANESIAYFHERAWRNAQNGYASQGQPYGYPQNHARKCTEWIGVAR